jgi:hypothetical protein
MYMDGKSREEIERAIWTKVRDHRRKSKK